MELQGNFGYDNSTYFRFGYILDTCQAHFRLETISPTHCRAALRLYPQAVAPHLGSFVPALADMAVGDRSKEARHYADRALRHALQIYDVPNGLEMAQAVLKAGLGPRPLYMSNQSQPKASGRAPERILGTMNLENL